MGDTLMIVIAILTAVVLMFVFPLMTMADRTDDVTQLAVETATTEFVDTIRTTGKITQDSYDKYLQEIHSTGYTYDVELEVQVLDENPGKKATQVQSTKYGENEYSSEYTAQIEKTLAANKGVYLLKEGDMVSVSVKNTNLTLSQQLMNFLYKVTGNDTYTISAQHGGIVSTNGK